MTVRKARQEDSEAIAEVIVKTWQVAYKGQLPKEYLDGRSLMRTEAFWRDALIHPRSSRNRTFVAVANGRSVGVVATGPTDDDDLDPTTTAAVYAIYLLPDFWGRGVGRSLVEVAQTEMRVHGFRAATLWVLETNARTRHFYEAAGWHPDEAVRNEEFEGAHVRELRYRVAFV